MDNEIQYLNTDLDLTSAEDLTALVAGFEARGVHPLHAAPSDDGLWYATFETYECYFEPETHIAAMLNALDSLPPELQAVWSRCTRRQFDIGYDFGTEPWGFHQDLSSELLGRMAAAGASLRVTIYPYHPESCKQSNPPSVDPVSPEESPSPDTSDVE